MKIVNANEMREIDRIAVDKYGIASLVLMERAGLSTASRIREIYSKRKVIALCGGGNNGGDGIAAARNLHNWGYKVKILMFAKKDCLSPDCQNQLKIAQKMNISIEFRDSLTMADIHGGVIIDAIFGTGLSKPVAGKLTEVFSFINREDIPVISVDIPSGVSSGTGEILGEAIKADYTVTFGLPKRGHFLYPGAEYKGRLFIEDIGLPVELLKSDKIKVHMIDSEVVSGLLPPRPSFSHKGDYGHVLIIAGSKGKTGAAIMCAKAAMRSGAGLVTLAVPNSLIDVFQERVTEEMTMPLSDNGEGSLSEKALENIFAFIPNVDVIAIGPGIGVSEDTEKIMHELIQNSTVPLVIDADGINSLAKSQNTEKIKKIFKKAKAPILLTPHPGEMARLLKGSDKLRLTSNKLNGDKDRINTAILFSKETGSYLVLKGAPTIAAEPGGRAFINTTGNPGMATAGTGDVLTGIMAAFIGQGLAPLDASILGVYLHGLSGDIAVKEKGRHSLIAADIIDFLSNAFFEVAIGKRNDNTADF